MHDLHHIGQEEYKNLMHEWWPFLEKKVIYSGTATIELEYTILSPVAPSPILLLHGATFGGVVRRKHDDQFGRQVYNVYKEMD